MIYSKRPFEKEHRNPLMQQQRFEPAICEFIVRLVETSHHKFFSAIIALSRLSKALFLKQQDIKLTGLRLNRTIFHVHTKKSNFYFGPQGRYPPHYLQNCAHNLNVVRSAQV